MYLGVPVVAQYVGGNPTMLKDDSGILVAPNEPYSMAFHLMRFRDEEYAASYSRRAIAVAENRQNNKRTISELINIYKNIISKQ